MKNIVINPEILGGKPIFEKTRIPVELVLDFLSQGYTIQQIIKEYPTLTKSDITGALQYVTKRLKEEEMFPVSL